jgi:hypothetical protein
MNITRVKSRDEIIEELIRLNRPAYLKEMAEELPIYPPLTLTGDLTVKEMYPDLTEKELDTVMTYYKGHVARHPAENNDRRVDARK